jgi:hypothetical protein
MTYELFRNGITTGIVLNGNGNPLQFGIFPELGQYSVLGTNPVGNCQIMMRDTITVVMNPTPVTDFSSSIACSGDTTFFTVSGDFIQQISTWFWDFGDGTYATFNAPLDPVHVFPTHGTYNVMLSVIDTNGCKYSVNHPVIVRPHPVAFFSINIPNTRMLKITDFIGMNSGEKVDKAALFDLFYGELGNAPMIMETPLNLECKLIDLINLNNGSEIYIGEIVQTYSSEKYTRRGYPYMKKLDPILFSINSNSYYNVGRRIGWAWKVGLKVDISKYRHK